MKKSIFTAALSATIIFISSFTYNAYGNTFNASSQSELENILLQQMYNYNHKFDIKYTGSLDNLEEVLKKALNKDPYIKSNVKSAKWEIISSDKASNININVDYIITSSKRNEADKKIDNILAEIIHPSMNDHEKVKTVHDYIVLNSKYDQSLQYYSDYDLLNEGTSVCNGYALLTYNMLNKLNIPVKLVTGKANGELHIWNMVNLDNYWFHLDTTWNDPLPDTNTVSYKYYMLTDKEIQKDHTIDSSLNLPKATKSYYDCLKELSYNNILMEIGLDIYDDVNTAEDEKQLKNILDYKIKHHPLQISVRINKSISQDVINNAMSGLFKYSFISESGYGQLVNDNTGNYNILNLYIKYKDTPDSIIVDLASKVYNTATKVNFNVYALYGNKKENITDKVLIYPYDMNKFHVNNGILTFKKPGKHNIKFEFQGIKETVSLTALNSEAFKYITDEKPKNSVNVKIYDQYINFDSVEQWPIIENNRTMVPLRAVFEVLSCNVYWDQEKSSAVVEHENTKILIPANSSTAYVNGKANTLDVPAKLVNNRIMVPLRFISETIDKTVVWDNEEQTVLIY